MQSSAKGETVSFYPEQTFREAVGLRFSQLKAQLSDVLTESDILHVEVLHVGSTAVPGSLTKGDLDIQVRVLVEQFARAKATLEKLFAVNEGGFSDEGAISFEDFGQSPSAGIHLTAIGSSNDIQYKFRDLLVASEALRQEYDDLKRQFEGRSMDAYRTAKTTFISRVLGGRSDEP